MQISNCKNQITKALSIILLFTGSIFAQIGDNWNGIWKGELMIFSGPSADKVSSVHMELHISNTDSENIRNWRIIYRDSTKDDRKYKLKTVDASKGKYLIDETDGVFLEANLYDNNLISRFEVMNNLLDISYKLESDKIVFEVSTSTAKSTSSTLSQLEQIEVKSYTVTSYQRAYLYPEK